MPTASKPPPPPPASQRGAKFSVKVLLNKCILSCSSPPSTTIPFSLLAVHLIVYIMLYIYFEQQQVSNLFSSSSSHMSEGGSPSCCKKFCETGNAHKTTNSNDGGRGGVRGFMLNHLVQFLYPIQVINTNYQLPI